MTDFKLTLTIDKVGDKEAIAALNDLDAKGRKIVEAVSGATGRAMGDIAVAYEKGSARMRRALDDVAQGHRENVRELERQSRAAAAVERTTQALAVRQATAAQSGARSLEAVSRAAQATGDGLNGIISQVSQLALGFGTTGPLVAAIGISTLAIVQMFQRAQQERTKLVVDMAADFERIANMTVLAQGRAAQDLYSGNKKLGLDPKTGLPNMGRFSVPELEAQKADFTAQIARGTRDNQKSGLITFTDEANRAAEALKRVNAELAKRNQLLPSITGRGGTIETSGKEGAAAEMAGFLTSSLKADAKAERKLDTEAEREGKRAWDAAVKAFARGIKDRQRAGAKAVDTMVADMTFRDDFLKSLLPTTESIADGMKGILFEIDLQIKNAIDSDPFLNTIQAFKERVEDLSKQMGAMLTATLGGALAGAFTAAFEGSGFAGALQAFGSAVLNGLGDMMILLGTKFIVFGELMAAFIAHVAGFSPGGQIAAGVGMIAAGAAIKAIAGSFGKSSGTSSGGGGGYGGGSGTVPRDFLSFGVTAGRTAIPVTNQPAPQARQTINIGPIIGAGDPKAQREIAALVNHAIGRNLIRGFA